MPDFQQRVPETAQKKEIYTVEVADREVEVHVY